MSLEKAYVDTMLGGRTSVLHTDAYKFSMAQAGFPLRKESFYLSYRKGGPLYNPLDLEQIVGAMLPRISMQDAAYLAAMGLDLTPSMRLALGDVPQVYAAPKGSWIGPGEPILRVTGPSFLMSWLEPLLVALHYPLQIATAILAGVMEFEANCKDEKQLVVMIADVLKKRVNVHVNVDTYVEEVRIRLDRLREAFYGKEDWANRCFEVGMRSASCKMSHQICMEICFEAGFTKTSNVYLARVLGLSPVGTMGHEHLMRWGSDLAGFRAMRDMRSSPPSYLLDTFDVERSGIPAAIKVMQEDPTRWSFVRFDSGNQASQMKIVFEACLDKNIHPGYVLEDGYNAEATVWMEKIREDLGIPSRSVSYGYGGYLVDGGRAFGRDRVGMVYKLCKTGNRSVMKTCGAKSSIPGLPVTLVNEAGDRLIAQEGERVEGFAPLSLDDRLPRRTAKKSPVTDAIEAILKGQLGD